MYLIFDTETNGLPKNYNSSLEDLDNWPRLLQLSYVLFDEDRNVIKKANHYVSPIEFTLNENAMNVNKISKEKLIEKRKDIKLVLEDFSEALNKSEFIIAHNIEFDYNIMGAEFLRKNISNSLDSKSKICTMLSTVQYCKIKSPRGGYKWPKLPELYNKLFEAEFDNPHDVLADVEATAKCFWELIDRGEL